MEIEIDSVIKHYGLNAVLSNVYLSIKTGVVSGLLGRNGTGKRTLMKIFFGVLSCEQSVIRVNKQYIEYPYLKKGLMQYLPQTSLFPLNFPIAKSLQLYDIEAGLLQNDYDDMKALPKYFGDLSSGQRRYVETLLVLRAKTEFLLLDEPFSFVAPIQIDKIKDIIKQEKANKGILLSDHNYKCILELSDDLWGIYSGQVYNITNDKFGLEKIGYIK